MRRSLRPGFTLVELLVVIAIIGVLVGLLLPAVQMAREAARRIECSNKIRQLSLALSNFESTKKAYPGYQSAFGTTGAGANVEGKIGSWAVTLLPFLEQAALRDIWDDPNENTRWATASPLAPTSGRDPQQVQRFYPNIAGFICASDVGNLDEANAQNSYICNSGFIPFGRNVSGLNPAYASYTSAASVVSQSAKNGIFTNKLPARINATAIFGANPTPVRSDGVRDGLSSTIAFTENMQASPWEFISPTNDAVRWNLGAVWLYRLDSGISKDPATRPDPDPLQPANKINGEKLTAVMASTLGGAEVGRPSSNHPGTVNVAMLDGSIISINEGIDYHVYQALMTPVTKSSDVPNTVYLLKDDDFRQ